MSIRHWRDDEPDPTSVTFFALATIALLCLCAHAIQSDAGAVDSPAASVRQDRALFTHPVRRQPFVLDEGREHAEAPQRDAAKATRTRQRESVPDAVTGGDGAARAASRNVSAGMLPAIGSSTDSTKGGRINEARDSDRTALNFTRGAP